LAELNTDLFIGNTFVEAQDRKRYPVINPATGETVALVADAAASDTELAVDAAAQAFTEGRQVSAKGRAAALTAFAGVLTSRSAALAQLITLENGKPLAEAEKELSFAIGYLHWYAAHTQLLDPEVLPATPAGRSFTVIKQPLGVVGAITPWNFPATMVLRKLAPALAAGCTVVLKPAPETPLTALAIAAAYRDAGLPRGGFNVLASSAAAAIGKSLMARREVRKITFTGSTSTGKLLMQQAAEQLKQLGFELGGNAPFIVFADADLERAVADAVAIKFLRVSGQSCICANRILVQKPVYDEFLARFTAAVQALKIGNGTDASVQIGPLISAHAVQRVKELVADALKNGARNAYQAAHPFGRGFYYPPTILTDVHAGMRFAKEEIFGPVAPVFTFDGELEAVELANATEYGLAGYVYTHDQARLARLKTDLHVGFLGINDAAGYIHDVPFGGVKESGFGREGGRPGLEAYVELKTIVTGGHP